MEFTHAFIILRQNFTILCLSFLLAGIKDTHIHSQHSHCFWDWGEAVYHGIEESSWWAKNREGEAIRPFRGCTFSDPASCHWALPPKASFIPQWLQK